MAVQAQHRSNILLLNRNGQEQKNMMIGGDHSMQTQTGGIIIDQPQMLYSNGVSGNPRKRGREAIAAAASLAPAVDFLSLQPQLPLHPTVVNLAQLQKQQPAMVSTGLRLAPDTQQPQMGFLFPSSFLSSFLSEDLSAHMKNQRDEIDQFLQAQGDELRRTLAERRGGHYRALLGLAEQSAARMLKEKDAELSQAARRSAALEERVAQLKAEAHAWESRATAQEAAAASLQAQLQQAMMMVVGVQAQERRGEVLRCAGVGAAPADDAESACVDPGRAVSGAPSCRACRSRAVSVVLLPCRHLCVCRECDMAVEVCPMCQTVSSASMEVFLS